MKLSSGCFLSGKKRRRKRVGLMHPNCSPFLFLLFERILPNALRIVHIEEYGMTSNKSKQ
jgi:hypothetical protein